RVSGEHQPGWDRSEERIDDDAGDDSMMEIRRKTVRPQAAGLAAVGSNEEQRVRGTDDARSGRDGSRDRSCVRTSELDQRGDSGGVVVRARACADVVEVRENCKRLG